MFNLLVRVFCCIILLTFSYIPGFIGIHVLADLIHHPNHFNGKLFLVLLACSALFYLFLLSFRTLTGKGRKEDDGLLPPWMMRGFILTLGVFSILSIFLGFHQKDIRFIIFGLSYVFPALTCYRMIKKRDQEHYLT